MDLSAVVLISLVCFVNGYESKARCLLFNRTCVSFCPRLTHAYHTRCDKNTVSQRTCDNPQLYEIGYTCGWSRCDCNGDLILDEEAGMCVNADACPMKLRKSKRKKGKKSRKPYGLSKKLRVHDEDDDPMSKFTGR